MSRDNNSPFRFLGRDGSRNTQSEANENEFQNPVNSISLPSSRTPLHTIPDPSQNPREDLENESNFRAKLGALNQIQALNKGIGNLSLSYGTPRGSGRGKAHSEPNSAQSTPARTVSKVSNNVGSLGACTGSRPPQYTGARVGSSSKVSRGISIPPVEPLIEVPHFVLTEDPSFRMDHNVQVLIRIRPINSAERTGYGRCLKQESPQTLTWLGHPETRFTFDHIACETISQEELFKVAGLPMVENCMSGYNSCMFAYGQTGSGKTYTMMGEIYEMDGKLSEDCGVTPRIFEYLFSRIRAEEENRTDEKLKYSCKCSFLEIYNEQITDLLEPASTNLQLREDLKKGVYVENLMEYEVIDVKDVIDLLLQGAANRKMAATHMNSESSRSHSVFTCIIESRWEKDSMTHLRFGRLNLVDLAGSERQKSSGAEGERLKEAANINKSLSTLGLVIMTLVDVAHGKHRHIPYRDSRLTFLLQDSLGGNSKTTIIANVSPSFCSANETLSTLKFARRAKLIQNNAKVNEDASGDVIALQQQIQQLKGQLTFLLNHHDHSRYISLTSLDFDQSRLDAFPEEHNYLEEENIPYDFNKPSVRRKKMQRTEAMLTGALRREKMSEIEARRLQAEIEHMNRLVHQREEDAQCTKMMLRFREEKIKRLEQLADGLLYADKYLVEENIALSKEIQLLQTRIDRNPELTRFALENIRLIEQLRLFQEFYEQGERETLLAEVSELRDQLLDTLEGNIKQLKSTSRIENQDNGTAKELESCKKIIAKLTREVKELRRVHSNGAAFHSDADTLSRDGDTVKRKTEDSFVEVISIRGDSEDETSSYNQMECEVLQVSRDQKMSDTLVMQPNDTEKELMDARSLIETMKLEQVSLIEELNVFRLENFQYMKLFSNGDRGNIKSMLKHDGCCKPSEGYLKTEYLGDANEDLVTECRGINVSDLQAKLDRINKELEETRILNREYQDECASHLSHKHEIQHVCEQVEVETTKTILHLQEEVATLQQELQERFCFMSQEITMLRNIITSKEDEIRTLSADWEKATLDLTSFLVDGAKSLKDATDQIESLAYSFPQGKGLIGENVQRAAKAFLEKEETMAQLQKSLEDAERMGLEMKLNLSSLKGVTIAITEVQQQENDENVKEAILLRTLINQKIDAINDLEGKLNDKEYQITAAETRPDVPKDAEREISELKMALSIEQDKSRVSEMKAQANAQALKAVEVQVELLMQRVLESENSIYASYVDTEIYFSALQNDMLDRSSIFKEMVQDLTKDIRVLKKDLIELKEHHNKIPWCMVESPSLESDRSPKLENQDYVVHQIIDELAETNMRLNVVKTCIDKLLNASRCATTIGNPLKSGRWMADCSTTGIDLSEADISRKDEIFTPFCSACPEKITEPKWDLTSERDQNFLSHDQKLGKSKKPMGVLICNAPTVLSLRKQVKLALNSFLELHVKLSTLYDDEELRSLFFTEKGWNADLLGCGNTNQTVMDQGSNQPTMLEINQQLQTFEMRMEEAEGVCRNTREIFPLMLNDIMLANAKTKRASSFINKIEEAQATMKEADTMLNALLRAKEDAKVMTGRWKQVGEELMIERARLIDEIQQLKSSIRLKEEEFKLLQNQIYSNLVEIVNFVSLLEGSFLQMQKDVEERFKVMYSDVFSLVKDLFDCICNSRSSLEDIWSEIIEKGFTLFALYQCHIGESFGKISSLKKGPDFLQYRKQECDSESDNLGIRCLGAEEGRLMVRGVEDMEEKDQSEHSQYELSNTRNILTLKHPFEIVGKLKEEELNLDNLISENLSLKKELARKDVLLKGLLFDFTLLQESTSNTKDMKDETENIIAVLSQVRRELALKTTQLDDIMIQHNKLESQLVNREIALSLSTSELEQTKETVNVLSNQNAELRILLEDFYLKRTNAEELLEEQKVINKSLEKEILRMPSSGDQKILSAVQDIENELRRVTGERDQLLEEFISLNDKIEMANAQADENQAIAVEARQESEASKIYAEQKEEEARILEHSVEELECTINVLEKKVYEMGEEVERHHLMRDELELELQALRQRLLTVETGTENMDVEYLNVKQRTEDTISRYMENRSMELSEARNQIRILEQQRAEQAKEIKQCKEYISELVLHSEAQASQYQQKYKILEAMVHEVKIDSTPSACAAPTEKSSTRTRGSSSPFRCISSLVQQMSLEKDQELSTARLQIEELEALAASRQKEVCMLNARLAAAESMTRDVIRDLLVVKLDMTNYANLIDQNQFQKLVEEAQQQTEEFHAKEQEIFNLRKQINDLIEERESFIEELDKRGADLLTAKVIVEQLRERDQLLTAQNGMLKMDKTNLTRRLAELDEILKKESQNTQRLIQENTSLRNNNESTKRVAHSEESLSRVNDELDHYCKYDGRYPYDQMFEKRLGNKSRNQKRELN